ncbi:MAG: nickel pincer cofactor biosynthesis protein LarC [Treponema sp.]|nr:nickel pincer cofactor biosynthesis protein LarC [Treponema sp.]
MKTLYIDCSMGAAGDMLTAALLELLEKDERENFLSKLNSMGLHGIEYKLEPSEKCGITGSHMTVLVHGQEEDESMHDNHHEHEHHHEHEDHHHELEHHHEHKDHHHDHEHSHEGHHHHEHSSMDGIRHIVCDHLNISESVKKSVMDVYGIIAEAESKVHGKPVTEIHFHEVGSMDAVADVTAVCLLMETLGVEKVLASPVHVGSGTVKCAHGVLPVPAPATANILKDIPVYSGEIRGELCTPTGAALLKYFVSDFCPMPLMKVSKIGYGMGKKDFERVNCVRVMLGTTQEKDDDVLELSCNLDDMTAEKIGFAMEKLFESGALDVYTVPVGMKKNRPGTLMRILCKEADKEKMVQEIFRHTTTNGIRQARLERYVLNRKMETIETEWGPVRNKIVSGYGTERSKLEYEDLARIARETGMSISEIENKIKE